MDIEPIFCTLFSKKFEPILTIFHSENMSKTKNFLLYKSNAENRAKTHFEPERVVP